MQIESPSLLITDDDRDFRETVAASFHARGFRTLLAADGEEAVKIVESEESIHLVMLDLQMPKLDGLATMQQIKKRRVLPWILVSGSLNDEVRQQATDAYSILEKPVKIRDVTRAVRMALLQAYGWSSDQSERS